MLSAEELALRRTTIGSSDVPAIVGSDPWKTRAHILERKLLQPVGIPVVAPHVIGHKLEKPIAEAALELGLVQAKVLFPGWTIVDEEGFASATPDFFACRDGNMTYRRGRPLSEKQAILLEVKVVGIGQWEHWGKGEKLAEYVRDQVLWQMWLTGHESAQVAALMVGADIKVFDVEMDHLRLKKLRRACRAFWEKELKAEQKAPAWARVALAKLRQQMEHRREAAKAA